MTPTPARPVGQTLVDQRAPSSRPNTVIASSELLRGQRLIEIDHHGQRYRLQATRQGKLILTK